MRTAGTRRAFIAAVLVLTLLPGLQAVLRLAPEFEVDEQRTLAPAPRIEDADRILQQANAWFSDHYGFRSLLIRLKAEIDFRVFGVSDKVHVGRDGYLFYRNTLDIEKPAVERQLAAHEDDVLQGIARYAAALHERGIGMVMFVNVLGDRFLAEKLPPSVAARPPMRRIDDFYAKLAMVPNLAFIDSKALLQETARTRPIFHRTDFHWNDPAAFDVAKSMIDLMSRAEGLDSSAQRHELATEQKQFSGGIARFMPLVRPPEEVSLFTRQNWNWPPGFASIATEAPYEEVTRTAPGTAELLQPTLFVGDSFFDALVRNGVQASFRETYRLRWSTSMTLPRITAAIPRNARWVVVQFIEVNQPAFDAFGNREQVTEAIVQLERRPPSKFDPAS